MAGRNRKAVDQLVKALRDLGRLEDVDAPLVTAARSLADIVDGPDEPDAALWRQYRQAVADLREVGADDGSSDAIGDLLAELRRRPAEVGDPPQG